MVWYHLHAMTQASMHYLLLSLYIPWGHTDEWITCLPFMIVYFMLWHKEVCYHASLHYIHPSVHYFQLCKWMFIISPLCVSIKVMAQGSMLLCNIALHTSFCYIPSGYIDEWITVQCYHTVCPQCQVHAMAQGSMLLCNIALDTPFCTYLQVI